MTANLWVLVFVGSAIGLVTPKRHFWWVFLLWILLLIANVHFKWLA